DRDVVCRRSELQGGKRRAGSARQPHSYLAHGGNECWTIAVDRRLSNLLGRFPWNLTLHVDNYCGTECRAVAYLSPGVFLFFLNAHHGRGHPLRPAEIGDG